MLMGHLDNFLSLGSHPPQADLGDVVVQDHRAPVDRSLLLHHLDDSVHAPLAGEEAVQASSHRCGLDVHLVGGVDENSELGAEVGKQTEPPCGVAS